MTKIIDIVNTSRKYLEAQTEQIRRFKVWQNSLPIVLDILNKICKEIILNNEYFKSNLYVSRASEKDGVYLYSGQIIVPLMDGQSEQGFQIHFRPIANGRISVFAFGHRIDSEANYIEIELINDPAELTEQKIIELVSIGIEEVRKTSYLFIGDT